jgi:hypothetical protein
VLGEFQLPRNDKTMPDQDNAKAADVASAEERDAALQDPTVSAHLPALREAAIAQNEAQRKVLAAWEHDGVAGQRELIVEPDGTYRVEESEGTQE